jgi:4'-phosphopantetheinyl transferase EntD
VDGLVPAGVRTASLVGDVPPGRLLPAEERALGRVGPARRRDYTAARTCARRALAALGFAPTPVLSGPDRAPRWPDGLVGSITHCRGYVAAAVARSAQYRTVGIDAEPARPLPPGVRGMVASTGERAALDGLPGGVPWDTVLFCAKESVYKAWYPLTRAWLGFADASVTIDPDAGTFTARLGVPGPVPVFHGRYAIRDGFVLTAIVVEAHRG